MKILKTLLFSMLLAVAPGAFAKTIEMDVNGLVCAFCAQGIEKTLKGFPATEQVFVSLEHRIVAVELKDGQDIDDAALKKAITDAGYALVTIRRTDESIATIRERVSHEKALPKADPAKHNHDMKDMPGMGTHE
ncbi:heavy-metal-associated domain-containing protein [Lysobacter sp. KIS68-7]|uniref:heavy-metal-associated domain-containing protein n=1 Tax=Lysobacter sp. KIS68-7 TaxID=2904252 RepID=UPI001E3087D7|nr:heavy-metal-associated domain-containing protein [Lysobacter sp. KIS68-7]UHQ19864.1 heavy-metal-associated domain-containing protein [Lysobacter sp. KIS68-7]